MKTSQKPKERQVFTTVRTNIECVFFMKTMEPVEPAKLVSQICQDAKACPDPRQRKTKYINRLTPVFDTDKATDKGIERVARTVLASHFELKPESADGAEGVAEGAEKAEQSESSDDSKPACTVSLTCDELRDGWLISFGCSMPSGTISGTIPYSSQTP